MTSARPAAPWADVAAWDRSVLVWKGKIGIAFNVSCQRPNNESVSLLSVCVSFSLIS